MRSFPVTLLTVLVLTLVGCDKPGSVEQPTQSKRKGELTRELAATILNQYLAEPSVSEIGFQNDGLDRAVVDGVMKNNWKPGDRGARYAFTDKGLKMVSRFTAGDASTLEIGGAWGGSTFQLKSPIGETVDEVTGITLDGPFPTAEFTTTYALPSEMRPMTRYVFSGRKATAAFRKYDDGWRVQR